MNINPVCKAILCFLFLAFSSQQLMSQNVNQQEPAIEDMEAMLLAQNLLDSTIMIGVFDVPDYSSIPRTLKTGVIPEAEEDYINVVIKNGIQKMNLDIALRGNFDSLIFIKAPLFETDTEYPLRFMPFTSTRWLLFLRSPYGANGSPVAEWVEKVNRPTFINANTTYEVVDFYQGVYCLKWNSEFEKLEHVQLYSTVFISDIESICRTLKSLPDPGSSQYSVKVDEMIARLKDPAGKIVGAKLKEMLVKK